MRKHYQAFLLITVSFMLLLTYYPLQASESIRPEVRALWVDAFHDGFKTPAQVDKLIEDSLTANINTLIVQVRRRGDAYYNLTIEPRTEDPELQPEFDALQYLITKSHAHGIEIHAWLNTLVAWNRSDPPAAPNHVWNLHGPKAVGRDNWVSYYRKYNKAKDNWSDTLYSSYYLDPGHPDALDYTVNVYLNVVKNYDIDGIHLDYSRYADVGWGYNRTNIARYNAKFGTTGMPAPDNPRWLLWKREQTANLMRKIYLKSIALKPKLKVSSAVITWGEGPIVEGDWEKSRAYLSVCQDWQGWLKEGIIDLAIPMNYFNEWNSTQQAWYNHWIEWEKDHQYGRQIVIGPGLFSQYIDNSLNQIRRAQAPSAKGNYAAGVALFAYGWNHVYSNGDFKEPIHSKGLPRQPHVYLPETNNWIFPLLAKPGSYTDPVFQTAIATEPVFPTPAPIPDMPWKSNPVNGYLMGTVTVKGKNPDQLKIIIDGPQSVQPDNRSIHREVFTDGSGWFGFAELPPGEYRVTIDKSGFGEEWARKVSVQAGKVAEVELK